MSLSFAGGRRHDDDRTIQVSQRHMTERARLLNSTVINRRAKVGRKPARIATIVLVLLLLKCFHHSDDLVLCNQNFHL